MTMAELTPAEQAFFATGDASHLQAPAPGAQGVDSLAPSVPTPAPAPNGPLEHQALSQGQPAQTPAPAAPAAPAAAPASAPAANDPADFLRQQLAATQQQAAQLQGQLQGVLAAQQQASQKPEEVPDPATDPIGHMMHQMNTLQKQLLALQQNQVQTVAQQQQIDAIRQFQTHVSTLKDQFAAAHPDYDAAVTYLRNNRVSELRALGLMDNQIAQQLTAEEWGVAEAAVSAGKNPAEALYNISKLRGYTPAAAAPGAPVVKPQGASLEAVQRAQAAAASLPAAPPTNPITVENLRQMGDSDLNKLVLDPKAWDEMAGNSNYPL